MRAAALLVLFAILCVPALAQETGAPVVLDGQVVLRIFDSSPARAQAAAKKVQERILWCISQGYRAGALRTEKRGGACSLWWGKKLIVTVDDATAKKQNMKAEELAGRWLANLRSLVASDALRVSTRTLLVPLGESSTLKVLGLARGKIRTSVKEGIVRCAADDETGDVSVKALTVGKTTIVITRSGYQATVIVQVKDWAGRFPDSVVMPVTGEPAPSGILKDAALYAAVNNVVLNPGAKISLRTGIEAPQFLQKGESAVVRLPLLIEGDGYLTVNRTMEVKLTNLDLSLADPEILLVSNRPESFDSSGILFEGGSNGARSVRLLYHHKNTSRARTKLVVRLTNMGGAPVELMASPCTSGPDANEIFVGHQVTSRFLSLFSRAASYQIIIPPHSFLLFSEQEMAPNETAAGIFDFHLVKAGELKVTVYNQRESESFSRLPVLPFDFNPFLVHPRGSFMEPSITLEKKMIAGEEPVETMFAEPPWLIDQETGEPNVGNYGTTYRIVYTITNPSRFLRRITFFFTPVKDIARGTFIVNGNLVETEILRPPQEAPIHSIELRPGATETVELLTMPEGGSYYPAKVVAR